MRYMLEADNRKNASVAVVRVLNGRRTALRFELAPRERLSFVVDTEAPAFAAQYVPGDGLSVDSEGGVVTWFLPQRKKPPRGSAHLGR